MTTDVSGTVLHMVYEPFESEVTDLVRLCVGWCLGLCISPPTAVPPLCHYRHEVASLNYRRVSHDELTPHWQVTTCH